MTFDGDPFNHEFCLFKRLRKSPCYRRGNAATQYLLYLRWTWVIRGGFPRRGKRVFGS
jgi:hypothetical protein